MQLAQSLTLLTESKENLGFGLLMKMKIVRSIGGYFTLLHRKTKNGYCFKNIVYL